MSENSTTHFSDKCSILADLWMNYRDDEDFLDFVEYNDLGLPLAYALSQNIIKETEAVVVFINETFDLLLGGLGLEDEGFDTLDDLLELAMGTDE